MQLPVRLLGIQIANGYSPEARVFAGLLAHLDRAQVDGRVLFHQWAGEAESAVRFAAEAGVSVETLDFGWRSVAADRPLAAKIRARLQFLAALPRALALARRAHPDIIYSCQQFWDCQAATYVARKLSLPQVIHLHYIVGPWLHRPVLERLRTCDHVIAVSDFIREEALRHGVPPDRVTTIRNTMALPPLPASTVGLDLRRELGIAPDSPLVGIVARLDPDKSQADVLNAFAAVRKTCPTARLLIVGDETPWHPGYADVLKRQAEGLGLGESALFLGRRSDVPRLLAALDVFVHPTRRDPCPLALLEASAAGLPVVAYAEGGAKEIVLDGVTGLLSEPGDVPALAASLRRLLGDPVGARRMGAAGRARIGSEFQPSSAGAAFASVLEQVAKDKRKK